MKNIFKLFVLLTLLLPSASFAAFSIGWNATSTATPWITPNLVNGTAYGVNGSYFLANDSTATSTFPNLITDRYFRVGPDIFDLTGVPWSPEYFADFVHDDDSYGVVSFGNFNTGSSASIDITLNNASTSSDGIYADIGMNSPNYNRPEYGAQNVKNLVYMYATGTPMSFASIGNTASTSFIQFITGSTLNTSEASRISNTGAWGIGSTSPSARLVVTNPLSTRTVVFEDQANDTTPFAIDASGNTSVGGSFISAGVITASTDISVNGGDVYNSSADLRILSEDSLYLGADFNNDNADSSSGFGIVFSKNTGATAPSANNILGIFKENTMFSLGTSTTNSTFTVVATSTSATTTVEFGDRYTSASKVCFNTKNTAGGSISFYFVGTTLTVENNRCN